MGFRRGARGGHPVSGATPLLSQLILASVTLRLGKRNYVLSKFVSGVSGDGKEGRKCTAGERKGNNLQKQFCDEKKSSVISDATRWIRFSRPLGFIAETGPDRANVTEVWRSDSCLPFDPPRPGSQLGRSYGRVRRYPSDPRSSAAIGSREPSCLPPGPPELTPSKNSPAVGGGDPRVYGRFTES